MADHYWRENGRVVVSPTYESWRKMKARCTNKSSNRYYRYGARGITYDPRWNSFQAFLADMGERPAGKTLDRIDNDKAYCKVNCKWSTATEQRRNRSDSKLDAAKVARIRELAAAGIRGHAIDRLMGVARGASGKILRGESWTDVAC